METPPRPKVWVWFVVYCIFNAVLVGGGFIAFGLYYMWISEGDPAVLLFALTPMIIGVLYAGVFLAPLFLKRRPWVWTYCLVLIALGLLSASIVFALPILIFLDQTRDRQVVRSHSERRVARTRERDELTAPCPTTHFSPA